jgi:Domain of unknown function (DUF4132)
MRLLRRGTRARERRARRDRGSAAEILERMMREHNRAEEDWYREQRRRRDDEGSLYSGKPLEQPTGRWLLEQPGGLVVSVLVAAVERTTTNTNVFYAEDLAAHEVRSQLARRKLRYTSDDVGELIELALGRESLWQLEALRVAVAAADFFTREHGVGPIERKLRQALEQLERGYDAAYDAETTALQRRIRKLLGGEAPARLDLNLIKGDDWGKRARRLLEPHRDDPAAGALIEHLARATSLTPSKRWRERTVELVTELDGCGELLQALLAEAVVAKDGRRRFLDISTYQYVTDANATLLRGIAWAAALSQQPWAAEALGALAEHAAAPFEPGFDPRSIKVANACVRALGEIGGDEAVGRLVALRAGIKHKTLLKQLEAALETAAASAGVTKSQLLERQVPDFGLDSEGRKEIRVGEATAVLARGELSWLSARGRELKSAPKAVREQHAEQLRALRSEAKEIKKRLGVERLRVEALLAEERVSPAEEWRRHYRDHPLVGGIARTLLWRFRADDRTETTLGGQAPEWAEQVELWHPIHAETDEVRSWRATLLEREIEQPFKQAHREVYLLAPAERETRVYSNRFAAHILRYPQAYALIKQRGWSVVALGPYDNDGGRQWRDFETHGIRAHFWMEHTGEDWDADSILAPLAATDQVRFTPIGSDDPLPLEQVPPIVFSEAMRDVDLFVAVTSIAGDPTWVDHGDDRYLAYWQEASFGELNDTAETRRELLRELLPQLSIADRLELRHRFLVVRGDLRTYKIHLGSGNVLMQPNDQYLCIVPARGKAPAKVFLPFPDDDRLSLIISKAFLLAGDTTIDDPTIAQQIKA